MHLFTHEVRINADKSTVWGVLSDIGTVSEYAPGIEKSHWVTHEGIGVGAKRFCQFDASGKRSCEERVTEVKDGEYYKIVMDKVNGMPGMVKNLEAKFAVETLSETETKATARFEFHGGFFGRLMMRMMKGMIAKPILEMLHGLKNKIEREQAQSKAS